MLKINNLILKELEKIICPQDVRKKIVCFFTLKKYDLCGMWCKKFVLHKKKFWVLNPQENWLCMFHSLKANCGLYKPFIYVVYLRTARWYNMKHLYDICFITLCKSHTILSGACTFEKFHKQTSDLPNHKMLCKCSDYGFYTITLIG